jgi:hypothetical protein
MREERQLPAMDERDVARQRHEQGEVRLTADDREGERQARETRPPRVPLPRSHQTDERHAERQL